MPRHCHWCWESIPLDVHWSWHNAMCLRPDSTPVVVHMDSTRQSSPSGEPPVKDCASHLTLHNILDHALFGPQDHSLRSLFDIFYVYTIAQPEINASDLPGVSEYHRKIMKNSLRRSTRNQPSPSTLDESEPELPDSVHQWYHPRRDPTRIRTQNGKQRSNQVQFRKIWLRQEIITSRHGSHYLRLVIVRALRLATPCQHTGTLEKPPPSQLRRAILSPLNR